MWSMAILSTISASLYPKTDNQCTVAFMEIFPGRSAYPRHYHFDITEVFYIVSGKGKVETPKEDRSVSAGDVIVFPRSGRRAQNLEYIEKRELALYRLRHHCDK
jgi:uncharacterized cupin superfamily protein